ncbi:MAG TPA: hypothetical protein VGS79_20710 [Puia sp.]|nr:hypothetical protein [Puia sp.]
MFAAVFLLLAAVLLLWGIDYRVLMGGNVLLFAVTTVSFVLYIRGLRNQNPYAFVRVMLGSMLVKFFVCLVAVLIYGMIARAAVNRNGILGCFVLYVLYTYLEVRMLLRMNRKNSNA